jgi:hypothetical protein
MQAGGDFRELLNERELIELLIERERLRRELKETGDRLKTLAPHRATSNLAMTLKTLGRSREAHPTA